MNPSNQGGGVPAAEIIDRLMQPLLQEAAVCIQEKIVADADLLDAGLIFGAGFAPFRGGPMQYAKTRGINVVISRLEVLARKYGDRFSPQAGWKNLTLNGNSSSMDVISAELQ